MCDTSKHVSGPYEQSHGYSPLESNKWQGILNVMQQVGPNGPTLGPLKVKNTEWIAR